MTCEVCGTELKKRDAKTMLRNKHHFCSRKCYEVWWKKNVLGEGPKNHKWRPKVRIPCQTCGRVFEVPPNKKDRKFCSMSCYGESRIGILVGERNPLWKGGVTPANEKFRRSKAYKEWRAAVYRRDRWTCQHCGYKGRQLIAHHIKKFSDYPELRLDVSNGITLCRTCHAHIENPQRLYAEPA